MNWLPGYDAPGHVQSFRPDDSRVPVREPPPLVFQPGHRPGGLRGPAGGSAPAVGEPSGSMRWTLACLARRRPAPKTGAAGQCRGDVPSARRHADRRPPAGGDVLLAHDIHQSVLQRAVQDLQTMTTAHNALLTSLRGCLAGELVALRPVATGTRFIDVNTLRSGTKLVLMILLLLVEEGLLGFPGGSQVAFFATFFASTGNLGRRVEKWLLRRTATGGIMFFLVTCSS
jgi:hypothetical protein